jgi:UDP-N-acetylglucosamine 1-carboxyvinyltransferase
VSSRGPSFATTDRFVVRGGTTLRGEIAVNGAKNSALKLMAAALLATGETVVENVPAIADVPVMGRILEGLGCDVDVRDDGTVSVVVDEPHWQAPRDHVTDIRASISVLGPLVGRVGRARLALPGGDDIGARSIDMHLRGLSEMGAEVAEYGGEVEVRADTLRGCPITLDFPSVGATENLLMAAALAEGQTVIENAAREPEVQDLCGMLIAMGAQLHGVGTPTLTIEGVDALAPVAHDTIPDRIEAATFAFAAALTRGDVTVVGARPGHLILPLMKLRAAGAVVDEGDDHLTVKADELNAVDVVTLPYPGFPTDLQPQLMVLLSQAEGTGIITENVFESRFAFVDQLTRLGADIDVDGHHAVIRGPRPLTGAPVEALDVRAGAASILAGMVADGETHISDVHHIDRGYARLVPRLRGIGADILRVDAEGHEVDAS